MNTGLPRYCNNGIPVPRVLRHNLTKTTEVPGKGMGVLVKLRKCRYGYESVTEIIYVPGIVARAYRTSRTSEQVQIEMLYPYPEYL